MERAAYRIIDANFNRSREAARVVEEYCRFVLNSKPLTQRAKTLRHELSAAIARLDTGRLMAARDTTGDVGAGECVPSQLVRNGLQDCLTAACKRLTEALRALGETVQPIDRDVAAKMEKLRFDAYALEKDILLFAEPAHKFEKVGLYVIITSNLPVNIISLATTCAAAGADCIQLRAKDMPDDELFAVAAGFVRICAEAGVCSIINDRADIAIATGADGIHLGQNDLPVAEVRKLQTTPLIIGKSTHSLEQLTAACDEPVTYAALGPVFATATKPAAETVGLEYVTQAVEELENASIASVAIGGIDETNIKSVLGAGADAVAVCSAITEADDPEAACRGLKEIIEEFNRGAS